MAANKDLVALLDEAKGDKVDFLRTLRYNSNGELKAMCRNNGLAVSGKKELLLDRLFAGAQTKKRRRDLEEKDVVPVVRQRVAEFRIGDLVDVQLPRAEIWVVAEITHTYGDRWHVKVDGWPDVKELSSVSVLKLGTHTDATFGVTNKLAFRYHEIAATDASSKIDMYTDGLWRPFLRDCRYYQPVQRCLTAVGVALNQKIEASFHIAPAGSFAVPLGKLKTRHLGDDLQCPGCSDFLYLPHVLVDDNGTSCGHLQCKTCLHLNERCVTCRAPMTSFYVAIDRDAQKFALSQVVACPETKCEWKGEIGKLDIHWNKECKERKIGCYYCAQRLAPQEFAQHVNNDCKERSWTCHKCNETDLRPGTHTECPEDEIECEFGAMGCPCPKVKRRDLDYHMSRMAAFHASWTLKRLKAEGAASKPDSSAMQEGS